MDQWEKLEKLDVNWREARSFGLLFFDLDWEVYGGSLDQPGTFPKKMGKLKAGTPDDATNLYRIILDELCERGESFRLALSCKVRGYLWLQEYCSWKERVAPPNHNLFFRISGRDCDGFSWVSYRSYSNIQDALSDIEDTMENVDGPTGYCTISFEEFESGLAPRYVDVFAEKMGY